jgi:hypothetical protein
MAALKRRVNTISTPTALNVSLEFPAVTLDVFAVELVGEVESVEVCNPKHRKITTGTTSNMKMTKVMRMLMSLSMRVEL